MVTVGAWWQSDIYYHFINELYLQFCAMAMRDFCGNTCTYWIKLLLWVMNHKIACKEIYHVYVGLLSWTLLMPLPYRTQLMRVFQAEEKYDKKERTILICQFYSLSFVVHFDAWIAKTLKKVIMRELINPKRTKYTIKQTKNLNCRLKGTNHIVNFSRGVVSSGGGLRM